LNEDGLAGVVNGPFAELSMAVSAKAIKLSIVLKYK
jgi:hypothetical protein